MRNRYIFFLVIVLLCIASRMYFLFNKAHSGTTNIQANVHITAEDLYAKYQNNEASANALFLNKVIEVKGTVSTVMVKGSIVNIQLVASKSGGINCNLFPVSPKDRQLPVNGKAITIKGRCAGFLIDVNLVDCVME